MAGNHKPVIRGDDDGIWRRLQLIPFTETIPEAERDPRLPDKLLAELPGILNWALQGCRDWRAEGTATHRAHARRRRGIPKRFGPARPVGVGMLRRRAGQDCRRDGRVHVVQVLGIP